MRSDDVCDIFIGRENVVVVQSPTVHQSHTYTVTTGTKTITQTQLSVCSFTAAVVLLYIAFVAAGLKGCF